MTDQPAENITDLGPTKSLTFTSPGERQITRTLFRLDDVDCYAIQPKAGVLMRMMLDLEEVNDDYRDVRAIDDFFTVVLDPDTADHLRGRLEDPEDGFDLDMVMEIMQALQATWGKGRGGRSTRSSQPRRRTGRSSTARRR
jgi:hypothetical protein